ncbi:hypothetical protein BBP00_00005051, partial [Phytophthora kernoviae]
MLAWMKKVVDKHPKTKGARLYSLLPVATTFQAAYVKLNTSTLHGLLARLIDLLEVENFLKKELNIVIARKNDRVTATIRQEDLPEEPERMVVVEKKTSKKKRKKN